MIRVEVDPGICGLRTTIQASSEDGRLVKITIDSQCPSIRALGESLGELDAFQVCFTGFQDSPVYQAAAEHFKHAACPVPAAIIKAVEAAAGLALPKNTIFTIERT
ncbi:DUF6951 family protein [Marispirochaeta sp.]|jgi:hypothetical protein|uniref:DUF6951 family protein n=1 Tax=Marispirochaeta sp. TaxID=2038653 RepID=UPI0029C73EF2|nr:hypothetical protein [Marispirochaeta sp.]